MNGTLSNLLNEVPSKPAFNPVGKAIEDSRDRPGVAAALQLFSSMPPSTGVLANPVRHHIEIPAGEATLDLAIRSFTVRGKVFEDDIVTGAADAHRVIFAGLFGRIPGSLEATLFAEWASDAFAAGLERSLTQIAAFMERFPGVSPDIVMQYWASIRKAGNAGGAVDATRPPGELLAEMMEIHMENVAVAASASFLRRRGTTNFKNDAEKFIQSIGTADPFRLVFSLLLRRAVCDEEARILGQLGAIQVHHGSAGSNMVARYLASLHTRSVSDLFTASQMALDCGRHFGAIHDMTDFVHLLEETPQEKQDEAIRTRMLKGSLPTFGHPEISAAGRDNHLEVDPRPALYLDPLFDAIDRGSLNVSAAMQERAGFLERMYQIAVVEGVEKPNRTGRLRVMPNTDFGGWLVQEVLGIEEADRTLISYTFRGFGWMMDVREQLQQPIIRPVIPADPSILPSGAASRTIPDVIAKVHARLAAGRAFSSRNDGHPQN